MYPKYIYENSSTCENQKRYFRNIKKGGYPKLSTPNLSLFFKKLYKKSLNIILNKKVTIQKIVTFLSKNISIFVILSLFSKILNIKYQRII